MRLKIPALITHTCRTMIECDREMLKCCSSLNQIDQTDTNGHNCTATLVSLLAAAPVAGAPSEVVQPSDGRASLLESIRNAGGIGKAKLRNIKERKMEKKKQKEQEQGVRSYEWRCGRVFIFY